MRWITRAIGVAVALMVLAWAILHWAIVPRIDDFRPRVERLASEALGTPVSIGGIEAQSNGLVPSVALRDVQIRDVSGRTGLRVPQVMAAFSVASLAQRGFEQLVVDGAELEVRRTAQGRLLVGGMDLSGDAAADTQAADWFFSQQEFLVRGGSVRWVDEQRGAAPVTLRDIQLVLRNGLRRHQMRLDATPEAAWGDRFTLIGQFRQPLLSRHAGTWRDWDGSVYADVSRVDVSQLHQHVNLKETLGTELHGGHGALRLWAEVNKGAWTQVTADMALGEVSATLGPQLQPLTVAALSGRLSWRPQGGIELSTHDLRFVDAQGKAWPGGSVRFALRDGSGAQPAGGELRGERLDLAALSHLASRLPLDVHVHERLRAHPLQGMVESLDSRWSGPLDAPRDWRVKTRVSALTVSAEALPVRGTARVGAPGIAGATLEVEATPAGGQARLEIRDGALDFPGVFEEPRIPLARLDAHGGWRVRGERIEVDVDELKLANADLEGAFKARWHTADAAKSRSRFPGVLDLQGAFSRANGARIHRYLPLELPADARRYVRDAVQKGEARDVAVRVKGDLDEVPFDTPRTAGEFRFAGKVQGVTLAYVPRALQPKGQAPWPPLIDLGGELIFERNSMQVKGARARVQDHPGWQFSQIEARIADLGHTRVQVDALGQGPLAAALGIVKASPVAQFINHALDQTTATGDASLKLALDLPVADINASKVQGLVTLGGNNLRIAPDTLLLAQAHGAVKFSDTGFAVQDARVQLLGGEARISGGSQSTQGGAPAVVLRASGNATAEGLRQMSDWGLVSALAGRASGSAAYEAMIGVRAGQPDLLVTSDLLGLAVDLPAPLGKPAAVAWPLRYQSGMLPPAPGAPARDQLQVSVGDLLYAEYERDVSAARARVRRGVVGVGALAPRDLALPARGVQARAVLPRINIDAWEDAVAALSAATETGPPAPRQASAAAAPRNEYLPSTVALRADELVVDGRTLRDVDALGAREGATWRADIEARELKGRVEYREADASGPERIYARLARLTIPPSSTDDTAALLAEPPSSIPALDIVVDEFELRGKKLGRLEVEAVNQDGPTRPGGAPATAQAWMLNRFRLTTPQASFNASGIWAVGSTDAPRSTDPRAPRAAGDTRHTALKFDLDIHDAGELLGRMGMPGVLRRGKGKLDGRIGWVGSPLAPHYPSMEGQLHLDVGAGQFLKADPGIAKLLGVLSLQSLPRRLALDFRDVFATGFAFDFVRGDVGIARGVASTNNLQMKGVNAAVLMSGSADIDKETQDLRVVVVPEIDAGTAALVATAINPAIGIGAFLAQLVLKRPLIQANTQELQIGGSWEKPQVTKLDNPARRPAGAASGAASKAPDPDAPAQETP